MSGVPSAECRVPSDSLAQGDMFALCMECEKPVLNPKESIVLTPDAFFIGLTSAWWTGSIGRGEAYEWCDGECFGPWIHRVMQKLGLAI